MPASFIPNHYPRTKVPNGRGRVLSDAQQHQYDVLRTVGGRLVSNPAGWWRVHSDTHRERIYGLNTVAMWKLVEFGLVVCTDDPQRAGYLFRLPELAKDDAHATRYFRQGQLVKAAT